VRQERNFIQSHPGYAKTRKNWANIQRKNGEKVGGHFGAFLWSDRRSVRRSEAAGQDDL
jgi:hypothetical protein